MPIFTFDLSDTLRERVEQHRRAFGLRSAADVLRHLIEAFPISTDSSRQTTAAESEPVSFGPVKRKPGALLKQPKVKK